MTERFESSTYENNSLGSLKGLTALSDPSSAESFSYMRTKANGSEHLPPASEILVRFEPEAPQQQRGQAVISRSPDGTQVFTRYPDGTMVSENLTDGITTIKRGDVMTIRDRNGGEWTIVQGRGNYSDYDLDRLGASTTKRYPGGEIASRGRESTVLMSQLNSKVEFHTSEGILVVDSQSGAVLGARAKGSSALHAINSFHPLFDEAESLRTNRTVRGWEFDSGSVQAADGLTLRKNPDGSVSMQMRR